MFSRLLSLIALLRRFSAAFTRDNTLRLSCGVAESVLQLVKVSHSLNASVEVLVLRFLRWVAFPWNVFDHSISVILGNFLWVGGVRRMMAVFWVRLVDQGGGGERLRLMMRDECGGVINVGLEVVVVGVGFFVMVLELGFR